MSAPEPTINAITFTPFRRVTDIAIAAPETITWPDLVKRLSKHERCADKRNVSGWSPATFARTCSCGADNCPGKRGHRLTENALEVFALVLDIDKRADGSPLDYHEQMNAIERLNNLDLAYVLHTTHSHTGDQPKLRGVLPISRSVSAAKWPLTWRALVDHIGIHAEPACCNADRFWYMPSATPGGEAWSKSEDGKPLDVDAILAAAKPVEPPRSPRSRSTYTREAGDFDPREAIPQWCPGAPSYTRRGRDCWDVECPQSHLHTPGSGGKHDTVASVDADGIPGFNCKHGHCTELRWRDFRKHHEPGWIPFDERASSSARSDREPPPDDIDDSHAANYGHERDDDPPPIDDDIPPIGDEDAAPAEQGKPPRQGVRQLARRYLAQRAQHPDGLTLRRWRGDWYHWVPKRGAYVAQSEERFESDLWNALPLAKGSELADVKRSVIAEDGVLIDEHELGSWLTGEDTEDETRLDTAACVNGLLHLPTGKITPATPLYFATSSIGTAYDPNAPSPERWLSFLRQLWPNDAGAILAMQEWIGYLLTPDTRQQKIALLVGPKRSGKGTIARVVTALLGGKANVASPTLASLATNFGLWPLIGKSAAIIGDARLSGRSDVAQVVERLLNISGEDSQTIDRKHREPWIGTLPTRITIISNETPRFSDASDALTARMLMFRLTESFYGHEDVALTSALLRELPSILSWAVEGWRRLRARGHFEQPDSGREALEEMADLASPVGAWAREFCRVERGDEWAAYWLTPEAAYESYCRWIEAHGHAKASMVVFGRDVAAATGCQRARVTRRDVHGNETRPRVYRGLVLRV